MLTCAQLATSFCSGCRELYDSTSNYVAMFHLFPWHVEVVEEIKERAALRKLEARRRASAPSGDRN